MALVLVTLRPIGGQIGGRFDAGGPPPLALAETTASPERPSSPAIPQADHREATVGLEVIPVAGGFRFELRTPSFQLLPVGDSGRQALRLPEGVPASGPPGAPDLDAVVRVIDGVPGHLPRVTVRESEFEDMEGVVLAPRATASGQGSDASIHNAPGHWPPVIAEVQQFQVDGRPKVRIEFRPVRYNPTARSLRHHRRISGTVAFQPVDDILPREERLALKTASSATEVADNCDCAERVTRGHDLLPEPLEPEDFQRRWSGEPSGSCLKLLVRTQGVYRVTRANLATVLGAVTPADFAVARLYTRDREVPILMEGTNSFLFYGEGIRSLYTDENAYFVGFGGPGATRPFHARWSQPRGGRRDRGRGTDRAGELGLRARLHASVPPVGSPPTGLGS